MVYRAVLRTRIQETCTLLAASMLLMVLCCLKAQCAAADSQDQLQRQPLSPATLVIQGRVTAIEGPLVIVKTPDDYPSGPGVHAQFVLAGPTFRADVSRARVLLPDGRRPDTQALAVGDRVLMVLSAPDSASNAPNIPANLNQTYSASIVERLVVGDKVVTH